MCCLYVLCYVLGLRYCVYMLCYVLCLSALVLFLTYVLCLVDVVAHCVYVCCDYVCCVYLGRVPKSDRTTVHKNLIAALGVAQLLLMCSDWASAHQVILLLLNYNIVYNIVVVFFLSTSYLN